MLAWWQRHRSRSADDPRWAGKALHDRLRRSLGDDRAEQLDVDSGYARRECFHFLQAELGVGDRLEVVDRGDLLAL
ncbi:hypothetical protein [Streptomyces wuyuanensis]|uniref:hypothetical protein n=1 Tax=Streptomyces wuyuanensis TaxID=1196353 RepID=UPI003D74FED1